MAPLTPGPVEKQTRALAWSSGITNNHNCFEGAAKQNDRPQTRVQPLTALHHTPKQELQEQVRRPWRSYQLKCVFSQGKKSTAVTKSAFIKVNQTSEHPPPPPNQWWLRLPASEDASTNLQYCVYPPACDQVTETVTSQCFTNTFYHFSRRERGQIQWL